jgi:hypothetical protein
LEALLRVTEKGKKENRDGYKAPCKLGGKA